MRTTRSVMITSFLFAVGLSSLPVRAQQGVVGGTVVPDGVWTATTAVYWGNMATCTGVLIAPDVVLTAGHCNSNQLTKVYVGGNDIADLSEGEMIQVAQRIEHTQSQQTFDVTILVLEEEASTPPVEIARDCILDELKDGSRAQVVGWGATNPQATQYPDDLMEAEIEITDADCSNTSNGCRPSVSPGGELIGGGDGVDSCSGDSGGPLYLWTESGDFYLVGLTSRATNDAERPCGDGGIYVRVDAILDWITDETGVHFPEASCSDNMAPEPFADPIEVESGGTETTVVNPGDPDPDDAHSFTVVLEPEHGTAVVDPDGTVTYTADEDYVGTDALEVEVDDGRDAALALIDVDVVEAGSLDDGSGSDDGGGGGRTMESIGGCGCATPARTSPLAGWLVAALAALALRRR